MDTRGQLYIVLCNNIAKGKQELILTNQRPFPIQVCIVLALMEVIRPLDKQRVTLLALNHLDL